MTAEEAVRQAEAAGLTLLKAASSSGYKGVAFHNGSTRNLTKPYAATDTRGGKTVSLGYFVTAEEAALCIARREKRAAASAAAAAPPPMTAEEAVRQADVEGLTLQKSDNNSGYTGIRKRKRFSGSHKRKKLYEATGQLGGKTKSRGYYATAEEAAVCRAGLVMWSTGLFF